MTTPRTLRFGAIALPPGGHPAAWRHPLTRPAAGLDLASVAAYARRIEDAGFSALIVGDDASVRDEQPDSLLDTTRAISFEPLTLTSALATLTDRIGLVPSVSTDFNEPFHVARRLATLDHLSDGRAGWNIDTGAVPRRVGGFLHNARHDAYTDRYERAEEFLRIVRGLWDSYADDALVADKRSGLYFRPGGRRPLHHIGQHFQVAGPLNVSRSPQGHPVVFHQVADSTQIGFAGRHADVLVTADRSIAASRRTRARLDERLDAAGRDPASTQVWPQIAPIVASTENEATARRDELQALLHDEAEDASTPFVIDTPEQVADHIDAWHQSGSVDGFTVSFPLVPADADAFLDEVLPLLTRRGSYRPAEGRTLRDFVGLPRPERSAA